MSIIKKIGAFFTGGESSPIKEVVGVVKDLGLDTKEEKRAFFEDTLDRVLEDREDARALYKKDAVLHKVYALVFLAGYIGLIGWIIYAIIHQKFSTITQFETGLVGTIFGAMSAKVNTVTDFLFGASDQNSEATKSLYEANNPANRAKLRHERKMARIQSSED